MHRRFCGRNPFAQPQSEQEFVGTAFWGNPPGPWRQEIKKLSREKKDELV